MFDYDWILVEQAKADAIEQSELRDMKMPFIFVRLQDMTMTT